MQTVWGIPHQLWHRLGQGLLGVPSQGEWIYRKREHHRH